MSRSAAARADRHQIIDLVEVLRMRIRGEKLTAQEEAALAAHTRPVSGPGTPHAEIMRELAERKLRERRRR
jgi:hypothetical protein